MLNQFKSVKEYVLLLLRNKPHLRDNDNKLIATIWSMQVGGMNALTNLSAYELLKLFSEDKLYSPESIRRQRQKIQEQYPDLRGVNYVSRQEHSKDIRYQIKTI